jgi:hypothetical protein
MKGLARQMIEKIYQQRAAGNEAIVNVLNTKLILKGVYPEAFTETTPDDAEIIKKIKVIAEEMGVRV